MIKTFLILDSETLVKDIIATSRVGLDVEHFAEFDGLACCRLKIAINQNKCAAHVIWLAVIGGGVGLARRKGLEGADDGGCAGAGRAVHVQRGVVLVRDSKRVSVSAEVAVVELEELICDGSGVHSVCCCLFAIVVFFCLLFAYFLLIYSVMSFF